LRSDLHNLFDLGYLTISLDYRVEVSRRIREELQNGRHYYALHGQKLEVLPYAANAHPAKEYLEWHHRIFKS
jgi:putative restriction endonuclease